MNGQILSAGTLIHPLPGAHHEDVRGLELLLEGLFSHGMAAMLASMLCLQLDSLIKKVLCVQTCGLNKHLGMNTRQRQLLP